jgi:hypothetical protein
MPTDSNECIINISKFKEWVFRAFSPEDAIYKLMQRERDEMTLKEAIAKTGIIITLIESSIPKKK